MEPHADHLVRQQKTFRSIEKWIPLGNEMDFSMKQNIYYPSFGEQIDCLGDIVRHLDSCQVSPLGKGVTSNKRRGEPADEEILRASIQINTLFVGQIKRTIP